VGLDGHDRYIPEFVRAGSLQSIMVHKIASGLFRSASGRWAIRALLIFFGLVVGVGAVEIALRVAGQPLFYTAHNAPAQFLVYSMRHRGAPVYVNAPSTAIRFVYDGNPRGYFDRENGVDHRVNSAGFRGDEFSRSQPADVLRVAFFGDSFTFGEGVKDGDVYPIVTARTLERRLPGDRRVESFNFGVGGYNTDQSIHLLEWQGLSIQPHAIVLGYVLNDAERPLFAPSQGKQGFRRRDRPLDALERQTQQRPPGSAPYELRTAQLIWQFVTQRRFTQRTLAEYVSLYEDANPGWLRSRAAIRTMGRHCVELDVPCVVVLFPLLYRLDDYPLAEIHDRVAQEVEAAGMEFLDLLPLLEGQSGTSLWVHPTDQHPNEKVHAIASEAIADVLLSTGLGEPGPLDPSGSR
jgi:lysophospholipase L1-like esterase